MAIDSIFPNGQLVARRRPISVLIAQELVLVMIVLTPVAYAIDYYFPLTSPADDLRDRNLDMVIFVLDVVWTAVAVIAYWASGTRRPFARVLLAVTLLSVPLFFLLQIAADPSFFGETAEDLENTVVGLIVLGPIFVAPFIVLPLMLLLNQKVKDYFDGTVAEPLSGPPPPPIF
jgi:hypothetical protein